MNVRLIQGKEGKEGGGGGGGGGSGTLFKGKQYTPCSKVINVV